MLKVITNYRYWALLVLAAIALYGIFAVPDDTLPAFYWTYVLLSTKIIGFATAYLIFRLYRRWERKGTIDELINLKNNY